VKDVYFSPERKYVVAIFRDKLDFNQKERLMKITDKYLRQIKEKEAGDYYLEEIYRWPTDVIEADGKIGIIVPIYREVFFSKKATQAAILLKVKKKMESGLQAKNSEINNFH
jgi:hypothetical protein